MKKFILWTIVIIFILFFIYIFDLFGAFSLLYSLNNIFPQNPDISCKVDSDCTLHAHPEWSQCRICGSCRNFNLNDSEIIAINKEWRPFCPFPRPAGFCLACIGVIYDPSGEIVTYDYIDSYVKCIENKCQKI
ncbi:MAG: hypothetical protein JSV63_04335 [Candidatus Aenigmatarchaeota archaeon]|nr:MAG: hypothetical protein JSV63_04335 [Candidatus Aenigmarchaeota archaeon]